MTRLLNRELPLEVIEGSLIFALLEVTPVYLYNNGKKTDSVIAYRYTVASPTSFEKYAIKVVNTRPLIVPELLKSKKSMGEQIFVKFHNATLKLYRSADGNFADSLKADSIELVDSE